MRKNKELYINNSDKFPFVINMPQSYIKPFKRPNNFIVIFKIIL